MRIISFFFFCIFDRGLLDRWFIDQILIIKN